MTTAPVDLGHGHTLRFTSWGPDRDLNPQYAGVPDVERFGAIIEHRAPDGRECMSGVHFDTPEVHAVKAVSPDRYPTWQVESWEPLTISPSLLCGMCGDHGFIRAGAWVPA